MDPIELGAEQIAEYKVLDALASRAEANARMLRTGANTFLRGMLMGMGHRVPNGSTLTISGSSVVIEPPATGARNGDAAGTR